MDNNIKILSVSEATLLFGIWNKEIEHYRGKKIVVVNRKRSRVVAAFQFVDLPEDIYLPCDCCGGTGKLKNEKYTKYSP